MIHWGPIKPSDATFKTVLNGYENNLSVLDGMNTLAADMFRYFSLALRASDFDKWFKHDVFVIFDIPKDEKREVVEKLIDVVWLEIIE